MHDHGNLPVLERRCILFAADNFAAADVFGPDMFVADLLGGATFVVDIVYIRRFEEY